MVSKPEPEMDDDVYEMIIDWVYFTVPYVVVAWTMWYTRLPLPVRLAALVPAAICITGVVHNMQPDIIPYVAWLMVDRSRAPLYAIRWATFVAAAALRWLFGRRRVSGWRASPPIPTSGIVGHVSERAQGSVFRDIGVLFHGAPATIHGGFSFHHHHAARRNIGGSADALLGDD